jgi:hypothetical protein
MPDQPRSGTMTKRFARVDDGLRAGAAIVALLGSLSAVLAQPATLAYMSRGDRREGLVTEEKSAEDIRLLSAIAEVKARDRYADWPGALRLRFFLPKNAAAAHVTVRQIPSPKGYYLLGDVTPPKPWSAAAVNEFRWPIDLIAKVYEYQIPSARRATFTKEDWMTDLGVVVALGGKDDVFVRQQIEVAPAVVFHSDQPLDVVGYQFTFRTNAPAEVSDSIVSSSNTPVSSVQQRTATAGRPFTVRWQVSGQPEGWYQLSLDLTFGGRTEGRSQQRLVRFYHVPSLSRAK